MKPDAETRDNLAGSSASSPFACIQVRMSDANQAQTTGAGDDPTADYRKYPKGPNFLLIVILACVVLLLVMVAAVLFLRTDGKKVVPAHVNPTPNSLVRPLLDRPSGESLA
jgi:hypothetical protein